MSNSGHASISRRRVALVCKNFGDNSGGTERSVERLVFLLAESGWDVCVWRIGRTRKGEVERSVNSRRSGRSLARGLRASHPDLTVVFGSSRRDYRLAYKLAASGLEVCFSEESEPSHALMRWGAPLPRPRRIAESERLRLLRSLAGVRCLRSDIWESLPSDLQERAVVIPNSADSSLQLTKTYKKSLNARAFIVVGADRRWKNIDPVIRAHLRMLEHGSDWRLVIFGKYLDLPRATLKAMNPKFQEFRGFEEDRVALYQSGQVLIIPSHSESVSLVALEAASLGVPILAFRDCAGVSAIVSDGENGILMPSTECDESALYEAMINLADDDNLRAKISGRVDLSRSAFDEKEIHQQWYQWLSGESCVNAPTLEVDHEKSRLVLHSLSGALGALNVLSEFHFLRLSRWFRYGSYLLHRGRRNGPLAAS